MGLSCVLSLSFLKVLAPLESRAKDASLVAGQGLGEPRVWLLEPHRELPEGLGYIDLRLSDSEKTGL